MLVRLSDRSAQVRLLIFPWNSAVTGVERVDDDALHFVELEDTERVEAIIDIWRAMNPEVTATIEG
jgi:hypothetical protein